MTALGINLIPRGATGRQSIAFEEELDFDLRSPGTTCDHGEWVIQNCLGCEPVCVETTDDGLTADEGEDDLVGSVGNGGSEDRSVDGTLVDVDRFLGFILIIVINYNNWLGVGYDPDTSELVVVKKIGGVESEIIRIPVIVIGGSKIGGVKRKNKFFPTVNGKNIVGGSHITVDDDFTSQPPGLVIRAPGPGGIFISRYQTKTLATGYGRRYGLYYGN